MGSQVCRLNQPPGSSMCVGGLECLKVAMPMLCDTPNLIWPRTETWFFCVLAPSCNTAFYRCIC